MQKHVFLYRIRGIRVWLVFLCKRLICLEIQRVHFHLSITGKDICLHQLFNPNGNLLRMPLNANQCQSSNQEQTNTGRANCCLSGLAQARD